MQIINRTIPREGKISTLLERLNDYIEPVDKNWFSKIKPADIDLLYKLKRVLGMEETGVEFPESFVEFVKYAGEDDGGLLSKTLKGNLSISDLVESNEEIYKFEKESLTPYYFEFLEDEIGMSYAIDLHGNREMGIYLGKTIVSDTFEKLLFQSAVRLYERKYFLINVSFGASINSLKESLNLRKGVKTFELLDELCKKYSLTKAWFSDEHFSFVYSEQISIYLRKTVGISGMIFGNNEKLVKAIANDLLPKIGAH